MGILSHRSVGSLFKHKGFVLYSIKLMIDKSIVQSRRPGHIGHKDFIMFSAKHSDTRNTMEPLAPEQVRRLQELANAASLEEELRQSPWPAIGIHLCGLEHSSRPTVIPFEYQPTYRRVTMIIHGPWKGVFAPKKKMKLNSILGMVIEKQMGLREAVRLARYCAKGLWLIKNHVRRGIPDCDFHGKLVAQNILLLVALRIVYTRRESFQHVIASCDDGLKDFRDMGGVVDYGMRMIDLEDPELI